jgi:hypothetical protein
MSIVEHRGIFTCMLRVEGNRLLARGVKEVSILHDNPERRIVVIIHLLKQEGILCTNSYKGIVLG